MVKIIFDIHSPFILGNEVVVKKGPVSVDWWVGTDLVVDLLTEKFLVNLVDDEFSIQITPELFLVRRKKTLAIGEGDPLPLRFLNHVQRDELDKARELLSFNISDDGLRKWFGRFEVITNNFLNMPNTFSILPRGSRLTRNLKFQIEGDKISNID